MDGQKVLASLQEESALCGELAALRQEQRRLIESGEAERLLDLLGRKQKAIARLTALEDGLRPLKSGWEQRRGDFPAAQRIAITEAFRAVRERLQELIAKETEDAEVLAAQKHQAAQGLETFDRKRRLETVYRRADGPAESRLLDRKDA